MIICAPTYIACTRIFSHIWTWYLNCDLNHMPNMATYELCINSFVGTHHDCSMCRNILRIGVTYTFYVWSDLFYRIPSWQLLWVARPSCPWWSCSGSSFRFRSSADCSGWPCKRCPLWACGQKGSEIDRLQNHFATLKIVTKSLNFKAAGPDPKKKITRV